MFTVENNMKPPGREMGTERGDVKKGGGIAQERKVVGKGLSREC